MISVIIPDKDPHSGLFNDIFNWFDEIMPGKFLNGWTWYYGRNAAVFNFVNKEDAMLFKLTWINQ